MSMGEQFIFKIVTHAVGQDEKKSSISVYEILPDGGAMQIAPCSCMAEVADVIDTYIKSSLKELNNERN